MLISYINIMIFLHQVNLDHNVCLVSEVCYCEWSVLGGSWKDTDVIGLNLASKYVDVFIIVLNAMTDTCSV